jgi:transposase InsO family protein
MSIPTAPWGMVGIDIIGPLPRTDRGNCYVITAVDYYSRKGEAGALADINKETVTQWIIDNIVCRHGIPDAIVTDRGSSFVNELAAAVFKTLGIKHHKSAAYHPQANGLVERFNQTLKRMLKKWVEENGSEWDVPLQCFVFAHATFIHTMHSWLTQQLMKTDSYRLSFMNMNQ